MAIDIYEYASALDEFLLKMDAVPSEFHPGSQSAIDRIATLLRIAEVTVDFLRLPCTSRKTMGSTTPFT